MKNSAVLLINCPDRKGLVAAVASLLYRYGANITHADQHQDIEKAVLSRAVMWHLEHRILSYGNKTVVFD
jgi:formyltetrahydrofolate deformylase